jgi:hypothetical protein
LLVERLETRCVPSTVTTLANFAGSGFFPTPSLATDNQGNLFGESSIGAVFELPSGSNTFLTRYRGYFNVQAIDGSGNIFGLGNGAFNYGSIIELAAGGSTVTTLATFNKSSASDAPYLPTSMVLDSQGNLFGTSFGGAFNDGAIFELPAGSSSIKTVASFNGANAGLANPGRLVIDNSGNLFGVASGGPFSGGGIFELAAGSSTISTFYPYPFDVRAIDSQGNFFGLDPSGGTSFQGAIIELAAGSRTITTVASFASGNGGYSPNSLVMDGSGHFFGTTGQGGINGVGTVFEVNAVPPPASKFDVTLPAGNSVVAGTPFLVTVQALDSTGNPVTSYSGPASITITSNPADAQGNVPATGTLNSNGFGYFLSTLKTASSYALAATAGSFQGTSSAITVTPAAATYFKVAVPSTATTGSSFSGTVTALDAYGNIDTSYSGKVHFTSSDSQAVLPTDTTLTGGMGTFNVTLDATGNQTITATDTISAIPIIGGTSGTIKTRGLTVTSFTPTATGFTATFSKPFVASDLSLYGTSLHTFQAAALVGKNSGPINGTLLMDPTNENVTFKATGNFLSTFFGTPILPDDTYTVTLLSGKGTHGFLDALGAGLDGANNGGHADYATTFTLTNAGKPILSIPDFARGPDGANTIKVPNNSAMGIPVTLSNVPVGAGVSDVAFALTYNTTLLTPTGGGTGDSSGAGSAFVMGPPVSVDATHSTVTFSWHNGTAQSGTVVLGDILANVPNSAANQYEAKELLHCGSITVNSAAFSGVVADGLHVNAYFGDVTGDGKISGLDVATAGTVASGSSSGLAAYKLVDPAVIGDIAGDASIDATAESDLASVTSNLPTPQLPSIPTGLTITPGGPDPTLSLAGGNAIVSVMLDHPHPQGSAGMEEAVLALTYDPKVLTVAGITLGSIPGAGWHLVSVVDQGTGQIGIDLYSTTPISATQAGSLVNIAYNVAPGASATALQLANSVTPNGRYFSTEVADDEGQYVLSPGINRLIIQPAPAPGGNTDRGQVKRAEGKRENVSRNEADACTSNVFEDPESLPGVVPSAAQEFQIGTSPRLNTLLFQNSPSQRAVDKLFATSQDDFWSIWPEDGNSAPSLRTRR